LPVELFQVVALGKFVDAHNVEDPAKGDEFPFRVDLIACEVSVADEGLARLVDVKGFW